MDFVPSRGPSASDVEEMPDPEVEHRRDRRAGGALFVALAALYGLTAARTVQALDSGELSAVAHTWGVGHPPGFPTFVLLAGAWSRLIPLPTSHALALLSAVAGAGAALAAFALARQLGVGRGPASATVLVWSLGAPTWQLHTAQEVLGVNHLATSLVLLAAWRCWGSSRGESVSPRRAEVGSSLILGLLGGAAVGVHTTIILIAPVALIAALDAGESRAALRRLSWIALGASLGLLTHCYLLVASRGHGEPRWGHIDGIPAIVRHMLRSDYGAFDLTLGVQSGSATRGVLRFAGSLVSNGAGLFAVVTLWGLAQIQHHPARRFLVGIAASLVLAGVVLPARLRAPETAWWDEITARFFPLAALYAVPFAALGIDAFCRRISRGANVLLVAWVSVALLLGLPRGPMVHRDFVRRYADDLLASLEPGSLLIGQSDLVANAIWEAQIVRGRRPDVVFVVQALLPAPWYSERLVERTGGYHHPAGMSGVRLLLDHALSRGQRVYLSEFLPAGLAGRFAVVPRGIALQVLPPRQVVRSPEVVEADLDRFFTEQRVNLALPWWQEHSAIDLQVVEGYLRPWRALASSFERRGASDAAARCSARIEALNPGGVAR